MSHLQAYTSNDATDIQPYLPNAPISMPLQPMNTGVSAGRETTGTYGQPNNVAAVLRPQQQQ